MNVSTEKEDMSKSHPLPPQDGLEEDVFSPYARRVTGKSGSDITKYTKRKYNKRVRKHGKTAIRNEED